MLAWIHSANDRLNRSLDSVAMLPLGFVVVLGFFVLATIAFEDPASAVAASHVGRFEG